jgi:dTDP-4-dehydrorhamnose 3,5-epimerase-like enzyme
MAARDLPADRRAREDQGAPRLIPLPRIEDERGSLSFVEAGDHVPFQIRRIYYLTGVPQGVRRGGHAHLTSEQLIVALAGSVRITVDTGVSRTAHTLDRTDVGLYIPALAWRELQDFSATAVCLVLSSQHYDASDYVHDFAEFLTMARGRP